MIRGWYKVFPQDEISLVRELTDEQKELLPVFHGCGISADDTAYALEMSVTRAKYEFKRIDKGSSNGTSR